MDTREEYAPLLDRQEEQQPQKQLAKRSTLLRVCPYILGNELCERLCYYGVATNMVVYLTKVMGGDPAFAAIMVAVFEGTCYTTPILGALLADSVWGRYKTIIVFSLIYLLGIIMLTLSSIIPDSDDDADSANPLQYGVLFASLAVISLGTGGIKPNVSAFGADQFDEADPQDRKEKESFFNWFYLAINVGSFIASTVIVYIQDSVSWTIGFAIPGVAMALAILLFWAGRAGYKHVVPTESPMARVVKVVAAAVKNRWKKHATPDPSVAANRVVSSPHSPGPGDLGASYHGAQLYQQTVMQQNGAAPTTGGMPRTGSMHQMPLVQSMSYRWLEDAVTEWQTSRGELVHTGSLAGYTPKQVEEVKLVVRLLPIFFTTVLYWTVYTQMATLFVQQGNLMDRQLAWQGGTFSIPSASMSLFNTLSVILLVWVYDALLEPALRKTKRWKMTLLRRQGWGMLVAAVAMAYAGGLEAWRLSSISGLPPCTTIAGCTPYEPSTLSAMHASTNPLTAAGATLGGPFGGMGSTARRLLYSAGLGDSARFLTETVPQPGLRGGLSSESSMAGPACLCPNQPAPVSIFWQAPSYFLIGLSEVFTSIGQLEFFYDQAPDVMRSCSMALCLLSTAIGSYAAGALTWGVQSLSKLATGTEWLPRDLNQGHMDLFFYLLAAIMTVNLGAFLVVAINYQYKAVTHKRMSYVLPAALPTQQQQQQQQAAGSQPRPQPAAQQPLGKPPRAVTFAPATAPVSIGGPRAGAGARTPAVRAGPQVGQESPSDMEVYSRSLAFVPASPNIPAPFR